MYAPVRRALISVYDKTGIEAFAKALADMGVEIISSGGTAKALARRRRQGPPRCRSGRASPRCSATAS